MHVLNLHASVPFPTNESHGMQAAWCLCFKKEFLDERVQHGVLVTYPNECREMKVRHLNAMGIGFPRTLSKDDVTSLLLKAIFDYVQNFYNSHRKTIISATVLTSGGLIALSPVIALIAGISASVLAVSGVIAYKKLENSDFQSQPRIVHQDPRSPQFSTPPAA